MAFESRYPFSGELLNTYDFDTPGILEDKINRAHQAFTSWRKTGFGERAACFIRLAGVLEKNKQELAKNITHDMGKPISEAVAEIEKCALTARYYAAEAENMLKPEHYVAKGNAEIHFEPLGVIFGIFPWNYPVWQVLRFVIPTLMAGNTAVFKHAENTPSCAVAIEKLFSEAGFPESVLIHLFASLDHIENIISHTHIKATTLTGSERAGRSVASLSGKYIKKTVLELGGSDPFIVLPGADIKAAAKTGAMSRFQNTGQSCISAKRFILHTDIYEEFKSLFLEEMKQYAPADPMLPGTKNGTLARKDLCDKLEKQVQETVQKGGKITAGAKRLNEVTFEPGLLENIPENSPAFSEELFGPVASFFRISSTEEAIKLANSTSFGLGASVWTDNLDLFRRIAREIESGMVYFNSMVKSTPELPFGGIKNSGIGRELSPYGIKEFTNHKLIYPLP